MVYVWFERNFPSVSTSHYSQHSHQTHTHMWVTRLVLRGAGIATKRKLLNWRHIRIILQTTFGNKNVSMTTRMYLGFLGCQRRQKQIHLPSKHIVKLMVHCQIQWRPSHNVSWRNSTLKHLHQLVIFIILHCSITNCDDYCYVTYITIITQYILHDLPKHG